jgi:hypothetical protein
VITLPGKIRTIQRIELVTVTFLPLLAALISRA